MNQNYLAGGVCPNCHRCPCCGQYNYGQYNYPFNPLNPPYTNGTTGTPIAPFTGQLTGNDTWTPICSNASLPTN